MKRYLPCTLHHSGDSLAPNETTITPDLYSKF